MPHFTDKCPKLLISHFVSLSSPPLPSPHPPSHLSSPIPSSPPLPLPSLQVICIIVENESYVSAFSDYQPPEQGGGVTPPPSEPPQPVSRRSDCIDTTIASLCGTVSHCNGQGRGRCSQGLQMTALVMSCGLVFNNLSLSLVTCHPMSHGTTCHMVPLVTFCHIP